MSDQPEEPKRSVKDMGGMLFGAGVPMPGMTPQSSTGPSFKTPQPSGQQPEIITTASAPPSQAQTPRAALPGLVIPMLTPDMGPPSVRGKQHDVFSESSDTPATPSGGESGNLTHFKKTRGMGHRRKPSSMTTGNTFGSDMISFSVDPTLTPTGSTASIVSFAVEEKVIEGDESAHVEAPEIKPTSEASALPVTPEDAVTPSNASAVATSRLTIPPPTPASLSISKQLSVNVDANNTGTEQSLSPSHAKPPQFTIPSGAMVLPPIPTSQSKINPQDINIDNSTPSCALTKMVTVPPPFSSNAHTIPPSSPVSALTGPPAFPKQPPIIPSTPSHASQNHFNMSVNAHDSAVYKSLQNQVALSKQQTQSKTGVLSSSSDNLSLQIPTYFPETTLLQSHPPQRNVDQIFMLGPIGASQKKVFKGRWAVLFRDRLDIYNKFGETKPWQSWPLAGTLVQSNKDADGLFISLMTEKKELFIRAQSATAENIPPNVINSTIEQPSIDVMHKAWLSALKTRVDCLEYLHKCKEMGVVHADERIMQLYDAQIKSPAAMHTIAAFATPELYTKLPNIPGSYIQQHGQHPLSKLPFEGACVDLAGESMPEFALRILVSIFAEPDVLPIFGVKFGGASLDLKATQQILGAVGANPASQLVQVDFSGASFLSPQLATPTNNDLLETLAKFFTSSHLTHLHRVFLKQSDLTDAFILALVERIYSAGKPVVMPLKVFDISQNKLSDNGISSIVGLLSTYETISNNLQHLNLSFNPFNDSGLITLSNWLALPRPTGSTYILAQQPHAPFKPVVLQGLYLQGLLCSDKGFIELAKALLYHVRLTTVDLTLCNKLGDAGTAALSHMLQINESIEIIKFGSVKLTPQGLTALRLFYRFGNATQYPELFGEQKFSLVGLATDAL